MSRSYSQEAFVLSVHRFTRVIVLAVLAVTVAPIASAQVVRPADLGGATLEDLMKIQITAASRREQRVDEVPAAVFVLTQDDIRRSGMRTLPELFRLVPGVQVAQLTSSNWAISIRGFNDQFSNKLLVLIDGRSTYKRAFSGTFWDAEDLFIDDIDRIEVIRGPGTSVWGANAVNGVINVVTKPAKDSRGLLVRLGGGGFDRGQASARYGGSVKGADYRVYSQWTARGDTRLAGSNAGDNWRALTSGARIDWARGADEWTLDGSVRTGDGRTMWKLPSSAVPDFAPRTDVTSSFRTGNVLGRWTRRGDDRSTLQVQSSATILRRTDIATVAEDTFDADLQYHRLFAKRHDVVAGGGYRFTNVSVGNTFAVSFDPSETHAAVASMFVQDDIALAKGLNLSLGSKFEHDTLSGWGLQPTARLMWAPAPNHHLWLAASRALRTPSLADVSVTVRAIAIPGPLTTVIGTVANPDYEAEVLNDLEAGYRVELASLVTFDATVFRGRYQGLASAEPLAPAVVTAGGSPYVFVANMAQNTLRADTSGVEIAAHMTPTPAWRLDASYSAFHLTARPDAASRDPRVALNDGKAPAHQWQVHSAVRVHPRIEVDAALFRTGALRTLAVPAYTRADARIEVTLTKRLSAIGIGSNLFRSAHAEYASDQIVVRGVPRSFNVQLVWKY
jgi:iron complex outermembrane receptor protein